MQMIIGFKEILMSILYAMKKKMSFVVLAVAAAGVSFPAIGEVAADAGIVVNGGFDEVKDGATVGWRNVGKRYVFRDGAGRNGSRGLCYENDDPTFYSFPGQNVALKAGRAYEFEVWVRTENLQGDESGATICIEWSDANGKWRGGAYPSGVKGTSGWTCVKGMTARIPADATSVRVNPYVRKGMTGKAWFDDVSIREYVPPPVTGLYSTAYRNIAADGDVTFRTELDLPDGRAGCQLWFSYLDVTGKRHRVHTDNAMCESVTLPVSSLKMGRQDVVAELFRGTNCVGSATCAFTRVERLPQRAVWFDKFGRTIVNGKPFFPLGMYWGAITTNKIETYAKGPFNCLMPYQAPKSTDLMDLCHEKGLKVIYSVKDIYHGTRWAPKGIASEEDEVRFIKDRVSRFKDHPALLAWYLNDELPLSMLPRLTARRALMEELDPGHPGWTVLYQYTMIRDYMPSFDVVGTDPYPIPSKPAATATEWTRQTAGGTLGCKPVWQVPQAFNWAAYKKTPEEKAKHRAPTEAELRSMCWQCIANGANGLVLYSFFDLEKRPNGEDFDRRWAECCRVGAEIRGQFPVLLSEDGSRRLTWLDYEPPDDDWKGPKYPVSRRGWIKDGDLYVLVVNGYEKARHVRVGLSDAGYSSAASVFGPAPKLVHGDGGDVVELDLAPLEPALVRLVKVDASHGLLRRNCADPWLFRQDGRFYLTQTGTSKVFVEEAETLSGFSSPNCARYLAYDAKSDPMLATLGYEGVSGVWSPEIHYFSEADFPGNGGWFMFTALRDSATGDSRHVKSIVLKSLSGKPEGPYGNPVNGAKFSSCLVLDKVGVPYPGWLVGQTVLRIMAGEWKGVYSLFVSEVGRGTADFHQEIRIARLKTPWQMASEAGIVIVPTQPWESIGSGPVEDPVRRKKVPYLPRVVEGATAVYGDRGDVYLIYSGSGYWTNYGLGQLTWTGGDPLKTSSWVKYDGNPVFGVADRQGRHLPGVDKQGAGHASFFTDAAGKRFMVYHAYPYNASGVGKVVDGASLAPHEKAKARNAYVAQYGIDYTKHNGFARGVFTVLAEHVELTDERK